ncbi:LuxR C-terminal-related transcriptional regulator [Leifsonia sp. Le1]|uniref:helix-turn-helix transcriptional regulator n=1 Tax=Leifsonia sp. Le1 TaxID=3404918 RepID=UPI003EBBD28B
MTDENVETDPLIVDARKKPRRLEALVREVAAREGWQKAAAVIEKNWDQFASIAPEQLLTAIKRLPGEAFVENPGLLVAANYLQNVSIGGDPRRFFYEGRLIPSVEREDDPDLATLILLTGQAAGARTNGRLDEAREAAEAAQAKLRSLSDAARSPMTHSLPHLRFQWGRSLDAADAPGALSEYEEAYDLALFTKQSVITRRAAGHIAWHHAEKGRLQLAELWLARAHAEPSTDGRYEVIVFLASALLRHDRADPAAGNDLARALALPLGEQWAAALWVSAILARTAAAAAAVGARLENEVHRHPEIADRRGANGRYLLAAQNRLARVRPGLRIERTLPSSPTGLDLVLAASDAYGKGEYAAALDLTHRATAHSSAPRVEASTQLITAAAHLAVGHPTAAAEAFRHANAIIERERMFSAYSFLRPADATKLARISGEPILDPRHPTHDDPALPKLSKGEQDVLHLLEAGHTMGQIAAELYVSPNTLKGTVRNLYRKLGVNSRDAAVAAARNARGPHAS